MPDNLQAKPNPRLVKEFRRIGRHHRRAIIENAARVVLGSAIVRMLRKGTKDSLRKCLANTRLESFRPIRNQETYRRELEINLNRLFGTMARCGALPAGFGGSRKWGHAAKILNLFMREIVCRSEYFDPRTRNRLARFLYCPLDSYVLIRLKESGISGLPKAIIEIKDRQIYFQIQDILGAAVKKANVPRIWFDDVWSARA